MPSTWNTGGPNGPLHDAQRRLGIDSARIDRLARDPEIHRLNAILCGLCGNYKDLMRRNGGAAFTGREVEDATATILHAEKSVGRIAVMLLASMEMVDEACAAYGLDSPQRPFAIFVGADADAARELLSRADTGGVPTGDADAATVELTSPELDPKPHPKPPKGR